MAVHKGIDDDEYLEVPEDYQKYINIPYGGLFGNSVDVQMVEKIIADPSREYKPSDFLGLIDVSLNSAKKTLKNLAQLNLIIDESLPYHPKYIVNPNSKQLWALTFLAYAALDDRDGTNIMNRHIKEYCNQITMNIVDDVIMGHITWYKTETTGQYQNFNINKESIETESFVKIAVG